MKVTVGGGYPLLKSAIARRLQADGIELTPLVKEADVVILVGGYMFDVMSSVNGRICEYTGDYVCEREFECMTDVVRELSKRAAVLVLAERNLGQINRILQAGARGYVSEGDDYSLNIGTIVRDVARGRVVVGPRVASELLQYQSKIQDQFTRREVELLWLCAGGYQVEEMADRLGVARGTVGRSRLYWKRFDVGSLPCKVTKKNKAGENTPGLVACQAIVSGRWPSGNGQGFAIAVNKRFERWKNMA